MPKQNIPKREREKGGWY